MEDIEELLRDAFRAGMNKGSHQSYFDAPLDETEYIDSIKDKLKLFFIPDVRLSFLEEVRKKWGESDSVEFDEWLYDQLNEA